MKEQIENDGLLQSNLTVLDESLLTADPLLMVPGPVTIDNVPQIRDVETLLGILRSLGATVDPAGPHTVTVDASAVPAHAPDPELASEIRGSFLLAAPLLARRRRAALPAPGADSETSPASCLT